VLGFDGFGSRVVEKGQVAFIDESCELSLTTITKSGVKLLLYPYRIGQDRVAVRYSVWMRISANLVFTPIRTEANTEGIPNSSTIRICTQIRVEHDSGVTTVFSRSSPVSEWTQYH